jgi:predicted O-methyltransferase YrrM
MTPFTAIQIGAERGCSTLAILEARPDAFVFSIDVGARPEEAKNVEAGGHEVRRVARGLGRSQNIGEFWPKSWSADLIYIDGDHRYDGVRNDIRVWLPRVRHGGILAFHDYILPEQRAPQIVGRVFEAIADANLFGALDVETRADRYISFRVFK